MSNLLSCVEEWLDRAVSQGPSRADFTVTGAGLPAKFSLSIPAKLHGRVHSTHSYLLVNIRRRREKRKVNEFITACARPYRRYRSSSINAIKTIRKGGFVRENPLRSWSDLEMIARHSTTSRRILEARSQNCFELTVPELRSFYPRRAAGLAARARIP